MEIEEKIYELENKLKSHEKRISQSESLFQSKPEVVKKKLSVKEFILSKKASDDQQRTVGNWFLSERGTQIIVQY